jgi:excisionase family DNA binding protein
MNNPKLYTVKEAARIVGVSTNTLYKYLDEGRIKAARGSSLQGRFRIPESALEAFLGIKIAAAEPSSTHTEESPSISFHKESKESKELIATSSNAQAKLPLKLTRLLLLIGLLAMFIDVVISPTITATSLLTRLALAIALVILAYQQGGFRARRA